MVWGSERGWRVGGGLMGDGRVSIRYSIVNAWIWVRTEENWRRVNVKDILPQVVGI